MTSIWASQCLTLISTIAFLFVSADAFNPSEGVHNVNLTYYHMYKNNCTKESCFWVITDDGYLFPGFVNGSGENANQTSDTPLNDIADDVEFLYWKSPQEDEIKLTPNCADCLTSFQNWTRLVVVSHGWRSSASRQSAFGRNFRYGFGNRSDTDPINVIFVNWERIANAGGVTGYYTVQRNVEPVGTYVGELLNFLVQRNSVRPFDIHFVGHSLGSHVANFAARTFMANGKMSRITGLDPARPEYIDRDESVRLDRNDAQFVEVIHTAANQGNFGQQLTGTTVGYEKPLGHLDFYPNSGHNQPQCANELSELVGACSHSAANEYFTNSIRKPDLYLGSKCDNCDWDVITARRCRCCQNRRRAYMGWPTDRSSPRGSYYISTDGNNNVGDCSTSTNDDICTPI